MQELETQENFQEANEETPASFLNKIEALEAQVKEKENKYLYLYADFENLKRRWVKERADLVKFGGESIARDLLEHLDNLERAFKIAMEAHLTSGLADGLKMTIQGILSSLQKQGVDRVQSLNHPFDPNLHEAIGQDHSELPAGTVIEEQLKGYTLHGRLLRPARVVVSIGPHLNTER